MLRRLEVLKQLGFKIKSMKDDKSIVSKVHSENAWFTFEFIQDAMICWSLALSEENLTKWIGERSYSDEVEYSKKIGIILDFSVDHVILTGRRMKNLVSNFECLF